MRVKFWPKASLIPVEICDHRYGAKMTFSHQTDSRVQSSIYAAELFGFKNNVRLGAFVTNLLSQYNVGISETEATGLMRHDIYQGTDYWKNPFTGLLEVIPDYYSTVWSSAGAAVFSGAIAGQTKGVKTPNHGQQMFDISDGSFGFDFTNSVSGASNFEELRGVVENQREWLKGLVGREISAGSYRNGASGALFEHMPLWIGMRNSVPSPAIPGVQGHSFYGFSKGGSRLGLPVSLTMSRETFISYNSTFRWWDCWNTSGYTKTEATDHFVDQLTLTLSNGGWYRDFCHFHAARNYGTLDAVDEFLQIFRSTVGAEDVHTCSNGEALEYMFLRDITSRVVAKDDGQTITVFADIQDHYKGTLRKNILQDLNLSCLNIPLSVKIDLSGTSLAGKSVRSNFGKMRSLGLDVYVVEIPFIKQDGFCTVVLSEGAGGIFNESRPSGTATITDGNIYLTSDMPAKAVLFSVATGGVYYDSLPVQRNNSFKTEHVFPYEAGRDYRVGIISEFGQSNLITV